MKELLERLVGIPSVSGHEDAMRTFIMGELSGVFDEMKTDSLGNLICRKKGNGDSCVLMTHMDCDGLIATFCDGETVNVAPLGSIKAQHAAYRRITFFSGQRGLLVPPQSYSSDTKISEFALQLGAKPSCGIPLGTKAYFDDNLISLEGDFVNAGTLSSRVGIACLIKAAKDAVFGGRDVYFIFTVQERLGGRGAGAALHGIKAGEIYNFRAAELGKQGGTDKAGVGCGAAINVMGKGFSSEVRLCEKVKALCKDDGVDVAFFTDAQALSDAAFASKSGECGSVLEVCIPVDNAGSSAEVVKMSDIENSARLAKTLVG